MCSSDQPIGPQSYPVILYNAFTNPVRGLLDMKSHLQSFNGCIYMKNDTLPCYCSSVSAKSRFACTELLSGPALPTERVHTRFGLKLFRNRSAAAISRFFCTELLGLLLVVLTLTCSESLWLVLNVTCLTL